MTPMFVVRMFVPGWAPLFMSFHKSRNAAERKLREYRKNHKPHCTFDILEA